MVLEDLPNGSYLASLGTSKWTPFGALLGLWVTPLKQGSEPVYTRNTRNLEDSGVRVGVSAFTAIPYIPEYTGKLHVSNVFREVPN